MFSKSSLFTVLSLSLLAAACGSKTEPPTPAPKPVVVAPKPLEPAAPSPPAPIAAAIATTPVTAAMPAPKSTSPSGALTVKRFVVASGVDNREPIAVESLELGELPVFAFAELANGGDAEQVVITFEREGSSESVGHVELTVPAETQRWRTWGKSNLISKPGRWSAVLRDQGGKELARTPFEVTGG